MSTNLFYIFLGVGLAFLLYAIHSSKRIDCVATYFHRGGNTNWFLSLSAANVTLGTGVIYYLTSAGRFGWLMLISPIMVLVGYYALARLLESRKIEKREDCGNFIKWAELSINEKRNKSENISILPTISIVTTFLLILAYEIYASSTIVSLMLFDNPNQQSEIYVAIIISFMTISYTLWGGIVAVLKTDKIQIIGVVAVILLMGYSLVMQSGNPSSNLSLPEFTFSIEHFWPLLTIAIGGFATQFYSILNWGAISNLEGSNPSSTLRKAGWLTAILLSIIVICGLAAGNESASVSFQEIVVNYYLHIDPSPILSAILIAGLVCIIFSTVDSLAIQITMFSYDNILKKNSRDKSQNLTAVRNVRLYSIISFAIVISALFVFMYFSPDMLYLLFAIGGGIIVYAPMLFLVRWLSNDIDRLVILNYKNSSIYFFLFILSFLANIFAMLNMPEETSKVVSISFFASCLYSYWLYSLSLKRSVT